MRTTAKTGLLMTALIAGLGGGGSCAKNDLPDYVKLGGLRVLALKASTPEVDGTVANAGVTITPLVSDITGAGRSLSYAAESCTDPGVGFGAVPDCAGAADRIALATGSFTLAAPSFTGTAPAITVDVPATLLVNRSPVDQFNGVAYLVVYTLTASDGTRLASFRRILASTRPARNQNPVLSDLLAGDGSLTTLPAAKVALKADYPDSSVETYTELRTDGTPVSKTEELTTTWFFSDGVTDRFRTIGKTENAWTAPATAPAGHSVVVVGVLHDERGGVDFLLRSL